MALPSFKIGKINIAKAIVQQGMAIMISLWDIVAPVINKGGVGIIGASGLSKKQLRNQINKVKANLKKGAGGALGVNIMKAMKKRRFYELVDVCIELGVDILFVGAGLIDDELVEYCKGKIELVPIVSRTSFLKMLLRTGFKPSAIVIEAGDAGGHLGPSRPESEEAKWRALLIEFKEELHKIGWDDVTVIIAGGLLTKEDVEEALALGADAVGMGFRFAMTLDCRKRLGKWQDVFLRGGGHAIVTGGKFGIGSPTGFASRMFITPLVGLLMWFKVVHFGEPRCRYDCLEFCEYRDGIPHKGILPFTISFCINEALRLALKGDPMGLYFPSARYREVVKMGLVWISDFIDYLDGIDKDCGKAA